MVEIGVCESCSTEIAVDAAECPECGNNPRKFIRNAAGAVILAGFVATIFHIPTGLIISGLGVAALIGIFIKDYPPTEYAFT